MFQLIGRPSVIEVTPQIAAAHLSLAQVPGDRPLDPNRLELRRMALALGELRTVCWATCFVRETRTLYRVNGRHTATVFVEQDGPTGVHAMIERYEADTMIDLSRLYQTFDTRDTTRTQGDFNHQLSSVIPGLEGLGRRFISDAVAGINFALNGGLYRSNSRPQLPAERSAVLETYRDFVTWLHDLIGRRSANNNRLHRAPVIAAIFATYHKDRTQSEAFWSAVRDETGFSPDLPDRRLAKFLCTKLVDTGAGSSRAPAKSKVAPREMYVKCIHAWNAYRRGGTSDLKYYPDAKVPAVA